MAEWVIESFGKEHDRSRFSCGKPLLDDFIRTRVSQYEKRRLGKTFVAVPAGGKQVIGYYTLAAGAVALEHLPTDAARKLPKHPVPVVLLARLAVDRSTQGSGLGEGLLLDALQRSLDLSAELGSMPSKSTRLMIAQRASTASTALLRCLTNHCTYTCR